jgi:hypothetical protein
LPGISSFEVHHALAGPFEQTHWIAFWLKESFQIREQRGIFLAFFFAPTPFFALSLSWNIALSRLHFSDPAPDGIL